MSLCPLMDKVTQRQQFNHNKLYYNLVDYLVLRATQLNHMYVEILTIILEYIRYILCTLMAVKYITNKSIIWHPGLFRCKHDNKEVISVGIS